MTQPSPDGPLRRRSFLMGAAGLAAAGSLSACGAGGSTGQELEFFQFKSEAIGLFDEMCKSYNATASGHSFKQNFQADNVTALRVRLVKERMPDAITINGDYNYGSLARSGVFYDFAPTGLLDDVQDAVSQILPSLGTGGEGQVNGLPLANNGSGIIYNKAIFAKHGAKPPTTWDELMDLCAMFESKGVDPIFWGLKDNWTGAPMLSSLSGDFLTDGVAAWYDRRMTGEVGFDDLRPVFTKMLKLASMGNKNKFELGYNDANQGFAKGQSAMYIHGTYAIPAIRSYNPDIKLGTFAMPADDEADTKVVSGVDVALLLPTAPKREREGLAFMEYLMAPKNMKSYCDAQVAYPTLKGMKPADEALQGLQPYFDNDRLATYSDHNFPQGMNLNNYMQQFLVTRDVDWFVKTLDTQWNKVTARLAQTR